MQAQANSEQGGMFEPTATGLAPPVLKKRVSIQKALDFGSEPAEPEVDPNSVTQFDLFSKPSCIVTIVFLGALMAYGVGDSLPLGESYLASYPYWLFALVGLCVAGIVGTINRAAEIPTMVAAGLVLVAGVVGTAAAHPALLRANALTDATAAQSVEYVRVSGNRFEPVEGGWPGIDMIGAAHWVTMPGEVRRTIPIRRGGLGFYQADLTDIKFELEMSAAGGPG